MLAAPLVGMDIMERGLLQLVLSQDTLEEGLEVMGMYRDTMESGRQKQKLSQGVRESSQSVVERGRRIQDVTMERGRPVLNQERSQEGMDMEDMVIVVTE